VAGVVSLALCVLFQLCVLFEHCILFELSVLLKFCVLFELSVLSELCLLFVRRPSVGGESITRGRWRAPVWRRFVGLGVHRLR